MKYIACYSGGKDSTAMFILAHEHNIKIDYIVFPEVMFNEYISGELPKFKEWGYKTVIAHSDKTYLDQFNSVIKRSKVPERNGKKHGFPLSGMCAINSGCKIKALNTFKKSLHDDYIEYVGIAVDEKKRLIRMHLKDNKISILEQYNYTEEKCKKLCKEYGLLSPIYDFANRSGCWFCPNQRIDEIRQLRKRHPDLWYKIVDLEKEKNLVKNSFRRDVTAQELERRFKQWER